ncbi:nitrogenase iron-molybdenum cofactor biosynthesis protein NifN [Rhodobacter sp. Har01]|uniref:nitrogenase iron-molybdenum cofactor biosynthesis protein NifN n=1 Tax=Rhodobacter sp. Har01 TaxID=2883999 RepID=UPI001D05EB22|nr:nitrogenase iron-molybdenum cofactor biosynthesis protein NifN [Rhodobacter sp. Har01]MCB6178329.1 nitrogenase iron-molybdenum cofactor biosynthesis protein NifN [Rhodobacter sp. Har01]
MARITHPKRALSTNPLKSSAPLGAAMAYLGIEGAIPLFHGAQGCTAFAMVHMVRHFKEAIPLQTTAMNEISAILGGAEQIEEAIGNLKKRANPRFIGIASTALTETRGEDVAGELRAMKARRKDFADTAIVYAATPDFAGGLEDGWARAVEAIIAALVPETDPIYRDPDLRQVNLLCGSALTVADVEELVRLIRLFGLNPIVLPDLSRSLDGHLAEDWRGTSLGGTTLEEIARIPRSAFTLAIGESMRPAAKLIEDRAFVPWRVFSGVTGLKPTDAFIRTLMELSGTDAPPSLKRDRARLMDAQLDAHFFTGGLRVALGADPDLLLSLSTALTAMGAEIVTAVTTSDRPELADVPAAEVIVGDLGDLERDAAAKGAQILITHSHGRQAADRLHLPLVRAGFPIFDRIGAQDTLRVGYRGSRAFLTEIANTVQSLPHAARPADFGAAPIPQEFEHVPHAAAG